MEFKEVLTFKWFLHSFSTYLIFFLAIVAGLSVYNTGLNMAIIYFLITLVGGLVGIILGAYLKEKWANLK